MTPTCCDQQSGIKSLFSATRYESGGWSVTQIGAETCILVFLGLLNTRLLGSRLFRSITFGFLFLFPGKALRFLLFPLARFLFEPQAFLFNGFLLKS
jgi:hypothetical protein